MKNQINAWKAFFKLSQKEAVGTLLLGLGLCCLTGLLSVGDYLFRGDPIRITPEDSASIVRWLKEVPTNSYSSDRDRTSPSTKIHYQGPKINPQHATSEQLAAVGLPKYLAERLIKYRSKGGQFWQESDLAKLYGITPEILSDIRPHLHFDGKKITSNFPERPYQSTFPKQNLPKRPSRFDINTADTTVWKSLPGIGSGFAKRICNFRAKLGGFITVEQVMETYQLPPELGPTIQQFGYVGSPVQKIQINRVDELKHPYLPYAQAKAILAYRSQHGPFHSLDDLQPIKRLSPEVLTKLSPYLSFEP